MRADIPGIGLRPRATLGYRARFVSCCATQYNSLYSAMEIRNIRHKGLRNFVERDKSRGLPQDHVTKIADIMAFLIDVADIDEVFDLKKYKPHRLTGERAGTYSLHVTANWRITFRHDAEENELCDVDFEDYH